MYQEVWKFKGFSLPPKGLILCENMRVLAIEAHSLALIDLRKKDICAYNPKTEDYYVGASPREARQSRTHLSELLAQTSGNKCCALIHQPSLHVQTQTVKANKGMSLTVKTSPRSVEHIHDLVIMREIGQGHYSPCLITINLEVDFKK